MITEIKYGFYVIYRELRGLEFLVDKAPKIRCNAQRK